MSVTEAEVTNRWGRVELRTERLDDTWLEGSSDRMAITQPGTSALGHFTSLPRGRALLEHWMRQLSKAERAALHALAQAYPDAPTKEQVARANGYEPNGGGFNNALSRLRTLELISGRGELRGAAELFE